MALVQDVGRLVNRVLVPKFLVPNLFRSSSVGIKVASSQFGSFDSNKAQVRKFFSQIELRKSRRTQAVVGIL